MCSESFRFGRTRRLVTAARRERRAVSPAPSRVETGRVVLPNYIALFQRFQTQNRKYLDNQDAKNSKLIGFGLGAWGRAAPCSNPMSFEFLAICYLVIEIWTLKVETFSKNAIL